MRPNKDILTCKEPGKCSIDEVEERPTAGRLLGCASRDVIWSLSPYNMLHFMVIRTKPLYLLFAHSAAGDFPPRRPGLARPPPLTLCRVCSLPLNHHTNSLTSRIT